MCYNCNEKHSFFQFCTQFLGSFVLNLCYCGSSSLRWKKKPEKQVAFSFTVRLLRRLGASESP